MWRDTLDHADGRSCQMQSDVRYHCISTRNTRYETPARLTVLGSHASASLFTA